MNFDEWLKKEMDKLDNIHKALKERHGTVDRDYQEWLFEDAKEPWEVVRRGNLNHVDRDNERAVNGSGKPAATDSGIVEIMANWGLIDDNGKLKAKKYIQPDDFTILARELEQHGYKYSKNARGFILPPKGVKS